MVNSAIARRRFLQATFYGGVLGGLSGGVRAVGKPSASLCRHAAADQGRVPLLLRPAGLRPFIDPLRFPERLVPKPGQLLRIAMRESEQRLHRDLPPSRIWGYNGQMPGPLIEARSGQALNVVWNNQLPQKHFLPIDHQLHGAGKNLPEVRSVVHLHGGRTPSASDGYPEAWQRPGQRQLATYPNQQPGATLWYHDHAMGIARLNLYAGLFGVYWLRDEEEMSLRLPKGEQEWPLVLADRLLTKDGQLYYPVSGQSDAPWVPEVFGDAMLVNGQLFPYLAVEPRRYRFRILNAANSRFFDLHLRDGRPFWQIGSDQGLLAAPVRQRRLHLAPGERADLLLDFSAAAGSELELCNGAFPLLQFKVGKGRVRDRSVLPARLRQITPLREVQAERNRVLHLDQYVDCLAEPMLMLLNGRRWRDPVSERVRLNSCEIWSLVNLTEDTHPIHLHLVRFQILDRRPFDRDLYLATGRLNYSGAAQKPPAHEQGWKDVVQAYPGMVSRIIIRFEGYPGRYVWHCHMQEHAANEMMRPFEVLPF